MSQSGARPERAPDKLVNLLKLVEGYRRRSAGGDNGPGTRVAPSMRICGSRVCHVMKVDNREALVPAGIALLRGPTLAHLMVATSATFRQEVVSLLDESTSTTFSSKKERVEMESEIEISCRDAPYVHGPRGPFDYCVGTTFFFLSFVAAGMAAAPHGGGVSGN